MPEVVFEVPSSGSDGYVYGDASSYPPGYDGILIDSNSVTVGRTYSSSWYWIHVGLLRFDTSSLNDACVVVSAKLRLYVTVRTSDDGRNFTGEWYDPGTIGPEDYTTVASETAFSVPVLSLGTGAYQEIPLADARNRVSKTGYTGLRLHISGGQPTGDNSVGFRSYDYGSNRPQLVVVYSYPINLTVVSPAGTQSSPATVADDTTPDLSGVYTSSGSYSMTHRQHQVLDELGNVVWDSGKVADSKASGSTVTATVPAGNLRYGCKYRWRWKAWDTEGLESGWSGEGWFFCSLTAVSPTDLAASDHLYAITPTGQVVALEESDDDLGSDVAWRAVYPITMPGPGTDLVLDRVWVVAEVPTGSTFDVQYSLLPTGDSDWSDAYSVTPGDGVQVIEVVFPIVAGAEYRSPFARLRLSGTGPFRLFAIRPEWREVER